MILAERTAELGINVSVGNEFDLTATGGDKKRSLAITDPENFGAGVPESVRELLRTVMTAHLVCTSFPEKIRTNFSLGYTIFLEELYKHYGYRPPMILKSDEQAVIKTGGEVTVKELKYQHANAHSGGLDSVYRIAGLMKEGESVLAVHLRNLNPKASYPEAVASREQCLKWGVPYEQVLLRNGSGNTGAATMRTRDMLLGLTTAIQAKPYGVKDVLIEGGMEDNPDNCHFSEYAGAWKMFNELITEAGLELEILGVDPGDVETVGKVLSLEKELGMEMLPLVRNCFSASFQIANNRRKWERMTPFLAQASPEHWCGSCIKCRRMTLGRISYQDERLEGMPEKEINFFYKDTHKWMKDYPGSGFAITDSFLSHLEGLSGK